MAWGGFHIVLLVLICRGGWVKAHHCLPSPSPGVQQLGCWRCFGVEPWFYSVLFTCARKPGSVQLLCSLALCAVWDQVGHVAHRGE